MNISVLWSNTQKCIYDIIYVCMRQHVQLSSKGHQAAVGPAGSMILWISWSFESKIYFTCQSQPFCKSSSNFQVLLSTSNCFFQHLSQISEESVALVSITSPARDEIDRFVMACWLRAQLAVSERLKAHCKGRFGCNTNINYLKKPTAMKQKTVGLQCQYF